MCGGSPVRDVGSMLTGRGWGHFWVKMGQTKYRQGSPTPKKGRAEVGWAENGCLGASAAQGGVHGAPGHPMFTGDCGVIYGSNWVKPSTTRALPHQKIDVHGLVGTEVGAWGPEQAREVSSGPSGVLSPPAWETRHRPSPPF